MVDENTTPSEPLTKKELEELCSGVLKHPAFRVFDDKIKKVLIGDIEWPKIPERDDIEKLPDNPDKLVQEQSVWLVEATGFMAMHLKRWIEEQLTPELEYWYKKHAIVDTPFTTRLMPIQETCENLLNVLPARLSAFQQRFREKYEQMLSVAKEADDREKRPCTPGKDIINFKVAAKDLYKIVMMIHSEALVTLKANLAKQPAEARGNVKRIVAAIVISFVLILLFELSVYFGIVTWGKNHPHTYGIHGSVVGLIPCLIFGFFKPGWRKWFWTAAVAFLVGLLTLL